MVAVAGEPLARKTTRIREKLKAKKVNPLTEVDPVVFRCIKHPELAFMVGGEVIVDQIGRQRVSRRGKWKRFYNTQFVATTVEDLEYCRSKSHIFEEPGVPESAKDANGKYDPSLDTRQVWESYDGSGFRTYSLDCWKAYQRKLQS